MKNSDLLFERTKLKQQINKYKIFLVLAICGALALVVAPTKNTELGSYIAKIEIDGVITEDDYRSEKIVDLAKNQNVKALIVKINSPGGTAYGGEQLYNAISLVSKNKPTVSVIGTVAASGGYMTAVAGEYIVAGKTSITGSIGVILQSFEVKDLLENKLGIKPQTLKSSKFKATPSPFETMTPEIRDATNEIIMDTYSTFVNIVQTNRKLSSEDMTLVANGKIFSGSQALQLKLIDEIGDENSALKWIHDVKKVSTKHKVKLVSLEKDKNPVKTLLNSFDLTRIWANFAKNNLLFM